MTSQQQAEQRRLEEILKLARMQLNEEYMKRHSAAHTTWLTTARTAWSNSGVLLPFATKFVYPSEEEVVARGVEIYNALTLKTAPVPPLAPATMVEQTIAEQPITEQPMAVEEIATMPMAEPITEPTVELLQAGGDFVIAEVVEEVVPMAVEEDITDVEIKEAPAEKPTVMDSLLESKFKSLFTKWGGKGNY